jgi:hypothetical protein
VILAAARRPGRLEERDRALAAGIGSHHALTRAQLVLFQRQIYAPRPALPSANQQRDVALVHFAGTQGVVQPGQHGPARGDHEAARGLPVQPVHELEHPRPRACSAQRLDHAVADAAAPVHRHSRWLVEHQQTGMLVQYRVLDALAQPFRDRARSSRLGQAHRRHANHIPGPEPVVLADSALVHAHLPAAQDAVDARAWQPL